MALTVTNGNGSANTVLATCSDDGDFINIRVRKSELLAKAKPSKTGQSQGVMFKFNHEFEGAVEGEPAIIAMAAGRGGAGTWLGLKPYPLVQENA